MIRPIPPKCPDCSGELQLDKEFAKHYTPRDQLFALPWVLIGLPVDVKPRVMAFLGVGGALVWRLVLRRPFERRERAIFRYA